MYITDNYLVQPNYNIKFNSAAPAVKKLISKADSGKLNDSEQIKAKKKKRRIISVLVAALAIIGGFFVLKKRPPSDSGNAGGGADSPEIDTTIPTDNTHETSKPQWAEYQELSNKVEQYNREIKNMPGGKERDILIEKRVEAYKKLEEYKIRAKAEDFSLIEMKDLSGASEIERWEYFEKYAFPLMENNEASTLDGIEMFEKYGMRKQLDGEHDLWHTTLERFMLSIPNRPSDRVIGRLFDVAYKYAEPNTKNDYYEVLTLQYLLSDLETHRIVDNIGEDSFLKAVKLAEKLEYWKTQYRDIPSDMEWRYIERKFAKSPRLPELKTAVEKLSKHIKK